MPDLFPTRPTRRDVLALGALFPLSSLLPRGLHAWVPDGPARSIVVVELEGGNDGLNTVIPIDDPAYARLRPRLGSVRKGALPVADGFGLHGALKSLHRLHGEQRAALVHSVGYPDPDRSHFRSRDIWHAADPRLQRVSASTTGWMGRAADVLAATGCSVPALAVGSLQVPLAMRARTALVPSLERIEDFQLQPVERTAAGREAVGSVLGGGASDQARWVGEMGARAAGLGEQLRRSIAVYRPAAEYPETRLGRELQLVAQVIGAGFGTRIFHVSLGGFDTHARQLPAHAGLLAQLDGALAAFMADLAAARALDATAVLVHSEFGRRTAENQSQGTDHGAAAPVFVLGGSVQQGPHGIPPDLGNLDDGDVRATTDFRAVYGALLAWAGIDAGAVLGADSPAPLAGLLRGS